MRVHKLNVRRLKILFFLLLLFVLGAVIFSHFCQTDLEHTSPANELREYKKTYAPASIFTVENDPSDKIDWHDWELIRMERKREGNGEHGKPAIMPFNLDRNKCDPDEVYQRNGYEGCLSDYISVNRSLPDTRPQECQAMTYRRHLPQVSIIIPVYNEHWSVLLRAIYSMMNRSPAKLLKEIILVDDSSSSADMQQRLDDYVATNLPIVRVLRLIPPRPHSRKGLMAARLLGAHKASGDILVFLDSNLEVNVNWLPPLIDPIAEDYRTCVCPVIDATNDKTFAVNKVPLGLRGAFDWQLVYRFFPSPPEEHVHPTNPFKNPVMMGCAFAISSRFFWELGGYDTGLEIWGGEQYELSFKVWQCGGILVDAPCSRVAHLYRGCKTLPYEDPGIGNYVAKNFKRVAEVWMDEYAEYVYTRKPYLREIDPGDLSKQREIRERLKCKPFKWFMEEIASDVLKRYPAIDPPDYGSGKIRPFTNQRSCLTVVNDTLIELLDCSFGVQSDQYRQEFLLSWHKDIEVRGADYCIAVFDYAPITTHTCRRELGNQLWRYNLESKQFAFGLDGKRCLAYNAGTRKVYLETCDETRATQKWDVDSVNVNALKKWKETEPLAK